MLTCAAQPVGLYEKGLPAAWSWDQRLAAAAEAGYDFVEISIDESDERLARLDWPASFPAELSRAIALSGVPILTMCVSGHRLYPFGSHSPQVRERARAIMRGAIDLAVRVGVRIVQVSGYDVFYEEADAGTAARYVEGVQQAAEWAAHAGVMLALENVDVPLSESIRRCMDIVHQVNSPWFHIYPDMANVAAAGYDPVSELALCAGHLVAVHVKDGLPRTIRRVPFGVGIVPFEPVFCALAAQDFQGLFTVEMWAAEDPACDPVADARAARQFVAELVAKTFSSRSEHVAGRTA